MTMRATDGIATLVVALAVLVSAAPGHTLAMPERAALSPPTSTTTLNSGYDDSVNLVQNLVDGNVRNGASARPVVAAPRRAVACRDGYMPHERHLCPTRRLFAGPMQLRTVTARGT